MEMIRVYRHEHYDAASRNFVRQAYYATEAAIAHVRGVIMYSTARDVPASQVDALGRWSPVDVSTVAPAKAETSQS